MILMKFTDTLYESKLNGSKIREFISTGNKHETFKTVYKSKSFFSIQI